MSGEADQSELEKAERWAVMEWILVRPRLQLLALLLVMAALGLGTALLYADGVSHLSRSQLRTFARRRYEEQTPRSMTGPLFGRLQEPQH